MQLLYRLWLRAEELKILDRKGWKALGRGRVESVADHSFALALLTMLEADRRNLDVTAAVSIALIHDLEEAITGDLTPEDKRIRGKRKVEAEKREAVNRLLALFPKRSRLYYARLWTDLRLLRTREARLVHDLDKIEMAFQAKAYEKKAGRRNVRSFYESARLGIKDRSLVRILNSLTGERLDS